MSDELPTQMESESQPVLILASIAAAATAITATLAIIPEVPRWVVLVVGLIGAVATAIHGVWTKRRVTPWADVAAKQTPSGKIVMGPAGPGPAGTSAAVVPLAQEGPAVVR